MKPKYQACYIVVTEFLFFTFSLFFFSFFVMVDFSSFLECSVHFYFFYWHTYNSIFMPSSSMHRNLNVEQGCPAPTLYIVKSCKDKRVDGSALDQLHKLFFSKKNHISLILLISFVFVVLTFLSLV